MHSHCHTELRNNSLQIIIHFFFPQSVDYWETHGTKVSHSFIQLGRIYIPDNRNISVTSMPDMLLLWWSEYKYSFCHIARCESQWKDTRLYIGGVIYVIMDSGRRRGFNSVLSSLSLLCVVLDLQLDGEISLFFFHTWDYVYILRNSGFFQVACTKLSRKYQSITTYQDIYHVNTMVFIEVTLKYHSTWIW